MPSMLTARVALALAISLHSFLPVSAQNAPPLWGKLQPGPYQIGYRTVFRHDLSRTYDVDFGSGPGNSREARPIQISLWYPAKTQNRSEGMPFAEYIYLLSQEEHFGTLTEAGARAAVESFITHIRWWTNQTAPKESIEQLMRLKTLAHKDAAPQTGRFPLILLAQGAHQSSFYHSILCEFLASYGYVVATSPSVGMTSRLMSTDLKGGETQARDLEYILAFMLDQPFVDGEKLGITAFSFGGIAAPLVQMRNSRVLAVLSLDSVIGFERLNPLIKQSPSFDIVRANVPYMHMMPQEGKGFDLGFLQSLKYSHTYVLRFRGLTHFDFSSLGIISTRVLETPPEQAQNIKLGQEVLCRYALSFFDAYLKNNRNSLSFIQAKPEDKGIPNGFVLAFAKPGLQAEPTSAQFANLILKSGAQNAIHLLEALKKSDPDTDLLKEATINILGYQMLFLGRVEDAIEVFKLNVGIYPQSFNVYDSLGEAYMIKGERELAIKNYERSLELNPDNTNASDKLKKLSPKQRR